MPAEIRQRATQGRTLAVMQVSGGSQSFNVVDAMCLLGRWMRMVTIPNQSSVPKAFELFDAAARLPAGPNYERLVDVCEELVRFTWLVRQDCFALGRPAFRPRRRPPDRHQSPRRVAMATALRRGGRRRAARQDAQTLPSIEARLKDVLDETLLAMPGAQLLVGLQYRAAFTPGFGRLPASLKWLDGAALLLILCSTSLLLSTPTFHQVAERGHATGRMLTRGCRRRCAAAQAPADRNATPT